LIHIKQRDLPAWPSLCGPPRNKKPASAGSVRLAMWVDQLVA
jgi:hypothetical protein